MSKKKIVFSDQHQPATVLGIASNERIWKLGWALNQALGLDLSTDSDRGAILGPSIYLDVHSHPDFEFVLFENNDNSSKVPKLARPFRFWLVIRSRKEQEVPADEFLKSIGGISSVSLAIDLSSEKDIQPLLP